MQVAATPPHRFFEWSLLGMLASSSVAIAVSGFLEAPIIAVAAAIAIRAARVCGWIRLPLPDRVFSAIAILLVGVWGLDYTYFSRDFLQSTLRLVGFLSAAMVIRARTSRDFFYVKLVALMQLVAAGVLSASLSYLLLFAIFAVFALAAQLSGEIRGNMEATEARQNAHVARAPAPRIASGLAILTGVVLVGILAIGAAMFLVLPRTATAALQTLGAGGVRIPGFSNEIRLGEIGRIRLTGTPVMHVRIDGPQANLGLKWRGSALSQFDGRRWFNEPGPVERIPVESGHIQPVERQQLWLPGRRISYEVQLKNVTSDVLFFAGIPESVGIEARIILRNAVDGYQLPRGSSRGVRYQVFRAYLPDDARPARRPGATLADADRLRYLQLPDLDPRVAKLARDVTAEQLSRFSMARSIERHLRSAYPSSMELPESESADPVAHFLFERKQGHCEYFASSMAVMLRTLGIPSRVATGFQSGTFNPMSGWHLVRSSDAHSWVEAFFDGVGWVTFDPTPPDPNSGAPSVWSRAGLYLDAADVFWQEWVVNYDLARQLTLVDRVGRPHTAISDWWPGWGGMGANWFHWRRMGIALACAACVLAAFWMAPIVWRWSSRRARERDLRTGKGSASDATLLYERMLEALRKRGVEKPGWMTPAEFVKCVPAEDAGIVGQLTGHYLAFRFGGCSDRAPQVLALVEELEGNRAATR